ncbi:hypothetical protein FHP25_32720 [Vineibacter terrae]|uniref:Uncharacterized protein n=1 Tax=Vineibacter terrae TaxID=2586908 RepID=A0A5C8PBY5_9HYPH|nr:hypothetical protein [Vineibacter terrae]TXL70883.1 hypothetical protein FHP25_32720 [Vineibacter terrae]
MTVYVDVSRLLDVGKMFQSKSAAQSAVGKDILVRVGQFEDFVRSQEPSSGGASGIVRVEASEWDKFLRQVTDVKALVAKYSQFVEEDDRIEVYIAAHGMPGMRVGAYTCAQRDPLSPPLGLRSVA